jgi:hypothetical protein
MPKLIGFQGIYWGCWIKLGLCRDIMISGDLTICQGVCEHLSFFFGERPGIGRDIKKRTGNGVKKYWTALNGQMMTGWDNL